MAYAVHCRDRRDDWLPDHLESDTTLAQYTTQLVKFDHIYRPSSELKFLNFQTLRWI